MINNYTEKNPRRCVVFKIAEKLRAYDAKEFCAEESTRIQRQPTPVPVDDLDLDHF